MRLGFVGIAIVMMAIMVAAAGAVDISGKWVAQMAGKDGKIIEASFIFEINGSKLTGRMTGPYGTDPIINGRINGKDLSFAITPNIKGRDMKFLYIGKVTDDVIKFKFALDGSGDQPIEFVARKKQ